MVKGRINHEKVSSALVVLRPGDDIGPVSRRRGGRLSHREVMDMEGFANMISMMDYVLDTKRKRHITGGLLLSAALLFGGLAMTVMSIKDEEDIYEQ